jgi:hypothetical protein
VDARANLRFSTGVKHITLVTFVEKDSFGVFIRIDGEDRLSLYERIATHKQEIEERMGVGA